MKFAKFLQTPRFTENLQWLLLTVSGLQSATFLKKWLRKRCFPVSFAKFLRTFFLFTEHLRMTASCVCLWVLKRFFRTLLLYSTSGKLLISCTSCRISTTRYSKRLFQRCFNAVESCFNKNCKKTGLVNWFHFNFSYHFSLGIPILIFCYNILFFTGY